MARVLVVDDEPTDRLLLKSIVEASGHEVHLAEDGEQAFKTYLRQNIELVITDLDMPRVDGLEFIEALRGLYPEARIIALSGKDQTVLDEAKRMGAFMALSKPIDPHELVEALETTLGPLAGW